MFAVLATIALLIVLFFVFRARAATDAPAVGQSIAAQVDAIMAASRDRFGHGAFVMELATITRLEDQRREQEEFIEHLLNQVEAESRDLVEAETANLATAKQRIAQIDAQLVPLRDFDEARNAHRESGARFRPSGGTDDGTDSGQRGGGSMAARTSDREYEYRSTGEYLADAWRAASRDDENAQNRLRSVGFEVVNGKLLPASRAAVPHTTTTEIPGLLPKQLVGEVMSDLDAARPFISSVGAKDLGGIPGKVFTRPTIQTHVTVGVQSAEKAEVAEGQFKVNGVDFTKATYGGWTNVSRQAIDWSSPAAWDALMADFQEVYGLQTENAAADAFVTAVTAATATVAVDADAPTVDEWILGLYQAAKLAYAGSGRMPDSIWVSLDQWVALGVTIDRLKASSAGNGMGQSSLDSFAGNLLNVPRIVVPSFATGTVIVGVKSRTEVYEDRIGFLSQVEPSVMGVQVAYGGYMASGTIKPAAFSKVTFDDS